jgi:hypothetical protein
MRLKRVFGAFAIIGVIASSSVAVATDNDKCSEEGWGKGWCDARHIANCVPPVSPVAPVSPVGREDCQNRFADGYQAGLKTRDNSSGARPAQTQTKSGCETESFSAISQCPTATAPGIDHSARGKVMCSNAVRSIPMLIEPPSNCSFSDIQLVGVSLHAWAGRSGSLSSRCFRNYRTRHYCFPIIGLIRSRMAFSRASAIKS